MSIKECKVQPNQWEVKESELKKAAKETKGPVPLNKSG
jgi:hypothetical protein